MVQQDKAYLEQVAAAVTETQSILKDVEAAADELSGQSSIVYENSVNAEGFDVLDEYYTLCTEKLNALNDAVETWSGSGQYFLIETTMLPFTATQDALQSLIQPLSAEEWANYLYNKEQEAQQSGGMVYVVDCDLAPVLNIQGLNY